MSNFADTGCPVCRNYWLGGRADFIDKLGVSLQHQAEYVRCRTCGQLWLNPNGGYPSAADERNLPEDLPDPHRPERRS